jgi:hypothetical protein
MKMADEVSINICSNQNITFTVDDLRGCSCAEIERLLQIFLMLDSQDREHALYTLAGMAFGSGMNNAEKINKISALLKDDINRHRK